jgi:ligand-binding sensor domain-containing protein
LPVVAILEDSRGRLWLGTPGAGAWELRDGSLVRLPEEEGRRSLVVTDIAEDVDGTVWIATNGSGVARYDDQGLTWIGENEGLASATVYAILQDREGSLWFGTGGGGVCHLVTRPGPTSSTPSWRTVTAACGWRAPEVA